MNRLLIISGLAAAACVAVAVPAVAGLSGNPSFSHRIPVTVPTQAQLVQFDDRGQLRGSATPTPTHHATPEPGDDRGTAAEPGDDPGATAEPGDDRGTAAVEAGDDRSTTTAPSDDSTGDTGGHHGGGSSSSSGSSGSGGGGSDDGGR
jgi:uncharacterized membrane protein YgcG